MCPFGELVGRVNRVLVLLVVMAHSRRVVVYGVGRHALIDIVIVRELNITSELDIVILLLR